MVRPKIERKDLLLSITKNFETLIEQTHSKPQKKLQSKLTKPSETLYFKHSIILGFDSKWTNGL